MSELDPALLEANGFAIVQGVVDASDVARLVRLVEASAPASDGARKQIAGGIRNILSAWPDVRELAESEAILGFVRPVLGPNCFPVRAILFDKTPESNWKVPWHQDLTIAVRERKGVAGFGPWTTKEGVEHVQPPVSVLENMLSVRLHLDDCGSENGPLRVLPATHLSGRLGADEIQRLRLEREPVSCLADAGGVVLMRPLLLHASSAATSPAHRRVIHMDYAAAPLPEGLEWHERCLSAASRS